MIPTTNPNGGPTTSEPIEQSVVQITTFNEDGKVHKDERVVPSVGLPEQTLPAQDAVLNDVIGFLSRRILLAEAIWPSGTGTLGTLMTVDLPTQWLAQQMIKEKLQGFRYLKCDLVFELQVNAQAFNAGSLIMWFNPLYSQMNYSPSSTYTLAGITGYEHVFYFCEDSTAVQLRVRFNNIVSHFDLVQKIGTFGRLLVDVASPLSGAADADVTLWCWAENVDVQMPTGLATLTDLPKTGVLGRHTNAQSAVEDHALSKVTNKRTTKQLTEKKATPGPVEKIGRSLGAVSKSLEGVPLIGDFAKAGSMALDVGSAVASWFGWSKPIDTNTPALFQQTQARHMANFNGDSKPKVLAMDAENQVDIPTHVFGTDEDEMAIAHIVSKPIFIDVFNFASTSAQGTFIWHWPVTPNACQTFPLTVNTFSGEVRYENYLSYLSNFFEFWRGGITYTIKFVKTPFHSGRVRIMFVPGALENQDPATVVDVNKVYSEVHDLRSTNEIEFTVPYTWFAPWKIIRNTQQGPLVSHKSRDTPTGMLYLQVVNSLRQPTTAANSIEALVFVKGAEDFQFSYPMWNGTVNPILSTTGLPSMSKARYNAQSNLVATKNVTGFSPNACGMGEAFVSLRQLGKRYHPWDSYTTPVASPFSMIPYYSTPPTPGTSTLLPFDYFLMVSQLFRFYSGSMRVLYAYASAPGNNHVIAAWPGYASSEGPASRPLETPLIPLVINYTTTEPQAEIEVPFYQRFPALPTQLGSPTDLGDIGAGESFGKVPNNTGTTLTTSAALEDTEVFRQIGETFSFGYLLGPPVTWQQTD